MLKNLHTGYWGCVATMLDAVVALKSLGQAKQRLATVLDDEVRQSLVEAMALDVIASLLSCSATERVHVIYGAGWSGALKLAGEITLWDEADLGTVGLIAALEAVAANLDTRALLFIHADLPLLTEADITELAQTAQGDYAVICPDAAGVGTNALLRWQHQSLPLCFGENSFARHAQAELGGGVLLKQVASAGLARDIDEPRDLRYLRKHAGDLGYHTARWFKAHGGELSQTATQSPP